MADDQALQEQPSHLANGSRGRSQVLPYQPHGFTGYEPNRPASMPSTPRRLGEAPGPPRAEQHLNHFLFNFHLKNVESHLQAEVANTRFRLQQEYLARTSEVEERAAASENAFATMHRDGAKRSTPGKSGSPHGRSSSPPRTIH